MESSALLLSPPVVSLTCTFITIFNKFATACPELAEGLGLSFGNSFGHLRSFYAIVVESGS